MSGLDIYDLDLYVKTCVSTLLILSLMTPRSKTCQIGHVLFLSLRHRKPGIISHMRGSRNFRQGGPGQSDKKSSDVVFFFFFFFLVLS